MTQIFDIKTLDEKAEMVLEAYKLSFDKTCAYAKVGLTPEEVETLEKDTDFQQRLMYFLVRERERVLTRLREVSEASDKLDTRLKALIKTGEILWPEKFSNTDKQVPITPVEVSIKVENEKTKEQEIDHAAAVLEILQKTGAVKSGPDNTVKSEAH